MQKPGIAIPVITLVSAVLVSLGLWWAIIYLPPWNVRAVAYVGIVAALGIALFVIREFRYRQEEPEIDAQLSRIDREISETESSQNSPDITAKPSGRDS